MCVTRETLIPELCSEIHLRNSPYLRVLLPRDPVPSERPGPQSESQPGPVYVKERECLLPPGLSMQDNPTAMKSETPQHPLLPSLQNIQMEGQSSVLCLSPLGASHPQEQTLRSWDRKAPFAHSLPVQHMSTPDPRLQIQLRLTQVTAFSC